MFKTQTSAINHLFSSGCHLPEEKRKIIMQAEREKNMNLKRQYNVSFQFGTAVNLLVQVSFIYLHKWIEEILLCSLRDDP